MPQAEPRPPAPRASGPGPRDGRWAPPAASALTSQAAAFRSPLHLAFPPAVCPISPSYKDTSHNRLRPSRNSLILA
ncbi:unnamed protein product [Rangifer tarandus platyrhynchus]|uniref:Uncharacterized protein n=2 Tax=Rangifer tarandus platyrhynchus TaxID=3082113 RepID=A0ACB0FMG3_RANTA|nr:unnamed protein product [Rangifer tarandus platyrhynchus]CAI9714295.1 unnamed protein product [Rangifer tarandus platyrhynchus]